MDSAKKLDDLQSLKNQINIVNTFNKWEQEQRDSFNKENKELIDEIDELKNDRSDVDKVASDYKAGSSIYNVIYLLYCFLTYCCFKNHERLAFYMMYTSIVLLVFTFARRSNRSKRNTLSVILPILCSGLSFLLTFYTIVVYNVGLKSAFNITLLDISNYDLMGIAKYYIWISIISACSLLVISAIYKVRKNSFIYNSGNVVKDISVELNEKEKELEEKKRDLESTIYVKKVEFFGKFPLVLDDYSNDDVEKIISILEKDDCESLSDAIAIFNGVINA